MFKRDRRRRAGLAPAEGAALFRPTPFRQIPKFPPLIADYEPGPNVHVSRDDADAAIRTAARFVDVMTAMLIDPADEGQPI